MISNKRMCLNIALFFFIIFAGSNVLAKAMEKEYGRGASYVTWRGLGEFMADFALKSFEKAGTKPQKVDLIVMTNAGYAEVNGDVTSAVLDGLSAKTGATRGRHTLIELHSAPWVPLWCAIYDKRSGYCIYLEVDPSSVCTHTTFSDVKAFSRIVMERINAEHLLKHPSQWQSKLEEKIFGGNEFSVITTANVTAKGVPAYVVRAIEFHGHCCPGLISGILIANYIKRYFLPGKGAYFVYTLEPWCKEDALLVLLNATPGKRAYAVYYPSEKDRRKWQGQAKKACTLMFRQLKHGGNWEGVALSFQWAKASFLKTGNSLLDKLCADLWYIRHLDSPDEFVRVIRRFRLPPGVYPKDWVKPGEDPLKILGLIKK